MKSRHCTLLGGVTPQVIVKATQHYQPPTPVPPHSHQTLQAITGPVGKDSLSDKILMGIRIQKSAFQIVAASNDEVYNDTHGTTLIMALLSQDNNESGAGWGPCFSMGGLDGSNMSHCVADVHMQIRSPSLRPSPRMLALAANCSLQCL